MDHPWLSIRMIIASTVLLLAYSVISLFLFVSGGVWVAVLGTVIFVGLQYLMTIKFAMWSTDAEPIPEEHYSDLHRRADELAEDMEISRPTLYFGDTDTPNAMALGRRGNGHVFISPELFDMMSNDELECILGHEFAHLRNRDSVITSLGISLSTFLSSGLLIAFWVASLDSENPALVRLVGTAVSAIVHLFLLLFVRLISRHREFVADADAVRFTNKPEAMANALSKLEAEFSREGAQQVSTSLSALCIAGGRRGLFAKLLSTHPDMEKRILRVVEMQ
ncbi:hypothetical protein AUR64_04040 [Haloprofundus marisrubri]|uniref:Peptidase M48 domain-containing protein n=1 Tax=Haloprofundus marisrubri TaxID=1514971 RepID=A0A0W1RD65_9EURY|nr:M48 family metalloprotease [Haloprofundus marisrubri]KTG11433.1 hypothetical protein AUR64_04040 [Haloprofundus marisrubri]